MSNISFDSGFFAGNREKLRQLFTGTAPIILTGNGQLQRSADEPYPFTQDRNFWYLTGIDLPDVVLVMDKGKEYLVVPDRESVREAFDGVIDNSMLSRISGIKDIYNEKEGWRLIESRVKKVQHVATMAPPPPYVDFWGMYTNPARTTLAKRLKSVNDSVELLDLRPHLARMRMIKQDIELGTIREAIDITCETIKEIIRPAKLAKYAYEYEIEADLARGYRRRGAEGHAFPPIVAGGIRTCTLHYMANEEALASGDLLVMDTGAAYRHYCSDITRTVLLGGQPSRRQQQVYDAVLEAQAYAINLIRPGLVLQEYEKEMESYIGEKLRELGLIKTIEKDAVRKYFPHATSHYLGLDTHDVGDYERPLEPGVVLAVEPGIYIPEEAIGIRIEDNVLVTAEGNEVLSAKLPRMLQ